jgi:hypothetical protein
MPPKHTELFEKIGEDFRSANAVANAGVDAQVVEAVDIRVDFNKSLALLQSQLDQHDLDSFRIGIASFRHRMDARLESLTVHTPVEFGASVARAEILASLAQLAVLRKEVHDQTACAERLSKTTGLNIPLREAMIALTTLSEKLSTESATLECALAEGKETSVLTLHLEVMSDFESALAKVSVTIGDAALHAQVASLQTQLQAAQERLRAVPATHKFNNDPDEDDDPTMLTRDFWIKKTHSPAQMLDDALAVDTSDFRPISSFADPSAAMSEEALSARTPQKVPLVDYSDTPLTPEEKVKERGSIHAYNTCKIIQTYS